MNAKRLFRKIHYWLSLAVFLPTGVIFITGTLLMLKKDISWIQPETQPGITRDVVPAVSNVDFLALAKEQPKMNIKTWADIDRVDIRPSKGIAKIQSKTSWELQVDTETGQVLQTAYRRSGIIEAIHDGSFFSKEMKYFVFLPTSILLVVMWLTGIYLFLLPRIAKKRKSRVFMKRTAPSPRP